MKISQLSRNLVENSDFDLTFLGFRMKSKMCVLNLVLSKKTQLLNLSKFSLERKSRLKKIQILIITQVKNQVGFDLKTR